MTALRVLGLGAAIALSLIAARIGAAGAPVWCHQVRPGDTLSGIARRYGVEVEELRGLNRLAPTAALRPRRILVLPALRGLRSGRLELSRPPLLARPRRLARESAAAARDRLSRMRNAAMVGRFRRAGLLTPVPAETRTYYVVGVSAPLRVARPWTRRFIENMAGAFHELFGKRLRVTSLTRTTETQRALARTNPSAAPFTGRIQSTHLTGAAVDLSKRSLSEAEIGWLRTVLRRLERRGLIHAVEEFGEPHFHVMVRRRYGDRERALGPPSLVGGC